MSTIREQSLNKLESNLRSLCDQDRKWNQFVDEESRQREEWRRLGKEKEELNNTLSGAFTEDERERKQQDLEIVQAKWNIANSKENVAIYQRFERECELEKSQLEKDDPKLAEIKADIKEYQGTERFWEKEASQYQTKLNKLMSEKNKDEC